MLRRPAAPPRELEPRTGWKPRYSTVRAMSSPSKEGEMRMAMPLLRKRCAQTSSVRCQKAKTTGPGISMPTGTGAGGRGVDVFVAERGAEQADERVPRVEERWQARGAVCG